MIHSTPNKNLIVIGAAALVALASSGPWAFANPTKNVVEPTAMQITITNPDSDDQADAKLKTRNNGDGNLRTKFEAELVGVEEGRQYLLRITVLDIATGIETTAQTPPLIAQPPR